jgi:amino acid transporter
MRGRSGTRAIIRHLSTTISIINFIIIVIIVIIIIIIIIGGHSGHPHPTESSLNDNTHTVGAQTYEEFENLVCQR